MRSSTSTEWTDRGTWSGSTTDQRRDSQGGSRPVSGTAAAPRRRRRTRPRRRQSARAAARALRGRIASPIRPPMHPGTRKADASWICGSEDGAAPWITLGRGSPGGDSRRYGADTGPKSPGLHIWPRGGHGRPAGARCGTCRSDLRQRAGDPSITLTMNRMRKSPTTSASAPMSLGCADCTMRLPQACRTGFPAGSLQA